MSDDIRMSGSELRKAIRPLILRSTIVPRPHGWIFPAVNASRNDELRVWVQNERKRLGLTQAELATRLGKSRASFARLEAGQTRFTWEEGWAVIEALTTYEQPAAEPPPIPA